MLTGVFILSFGQHPHAHTNTQLHAHTHALRETYTHTILKQQQRQPAQEPKEKGNITVEKDDIDG